ncbi:endonuclease-reverse transcriptase [Elysia marginata]|uniref:Endonuclease-reverse transcriptase n=1 Tax=Elysia marginata TaxID=1093978 RepID=A0AAV4ISI7_9GAST|nr:endonuclease-reverse transcriptase [Elysia marginata]
MITEDVATLKEVQIRIKKTRQKFWENKELLRRNVGLNTKKRILACYIFSVFNYGCETWTYSKTVQKKIQKFEMLCYRRLLNVPWTEKKTNKEIKQMVGVGERLLQQLMKRKPRFYECLCSDSSLSCDLKEGDSPDHLDKTKVTEIHIGDLPEDLYEPTFQCNYMNDLFYEDRINCVKMPKNYLKTFQQYCSHRSDQTCQMLSVRPYAVESCDLRCITLKFVNGILVYGNYPGEITEDECPKEVTTTTITTSETSITTLQTSESTPTELLSQKKNKEDNSAADSSSDLGLGISLPLIFVIAAALAVFYWREKIKLLVLPKQEARSRSASAGGNDIDADRTGDEDASSCYLAIYAANNTNVSLLP